MRRAPHPWDRFYRDHEAPWRGVSRIEGLLPWLGAGPVLELGCGNGKTLRPLVAAGVEVVGMDVSWHAVRRLAKQEPGAGYALADAASLPFAAGSFSAVLDLHCTGHLAADDRAAALREAWRVLRPEGVLWQERLGPEDLRAGQGGPTDESCRRVLADGRATCFLPAPRLAEEVEAAGFAVTEQGARVIRPRIRGTAVVRESLWLRGVRRAT